MGVDLDIGVGEKEVRTLPREGHATIHPSAVAGIDPGVYENDVETRERPGARALRTVVNDNKAFHSFATKRVNTRHQIISGEVVNNNRTDLMHSELSESELLGEVRHRHLNSRGNVDLRGPVEHGCRTLDIRSAASGVVLWKWLMNHFAQ